MRRNSAVTAPPIANNIDHVIFVLDASGSMQDHTRNLVTVVDNQVKLMAARSSELRAETRVTVYLFRGNSDIQCLIYDMDVLRTPSISGHYYADGGTPLVAATLQAIAEMEETPQRYGKHSFLLYVLSDGDENTSDRRLYPVLPVKLKSMPDNWTIAALVPNAGAMAEAKKWGFPAGNIAIWNTTSATGVQELGKEIYAATNAYMTTRSTSGGTFTGTKGLFDMGAGAVNAQTIAAARLQPMDRNLYMLIPVPPPLPANPKNEVKPFVEAAGLKFTVGQVFVPLRATRANRIAPGKIIVIREKATDKVYMGDGVRAMVGLPDTQITVRGTFNADYDVFLQSTSINRHLETGTQILYLK